MSSRCQERTHQVRCADMLISYEALPPNFSILQNCAAGAFAGIAVRRPPLNYTRIEQHQAYANIGAFCNVPCRYVEGQQCLLQRMHN